VAKRKLQKSSTTKKSDVIDHDSAVSCQVVIVGGGPVGLLLASRLLQLNIHAIVLEQRVDILPSSKDIVSYQSHGVVSSGDRSALHSKAIGIHPPSLELFDQLDSELVQKLCDVSVVVREGVALRNHFERVIGSLRLDLCKGPFNFVLSCPQHLSEALLRDTLLNQVKLYNERNGTNHDLFYTGVSVKDVVFDSESNLVNVTFERESDPSTVVHRLTSHFVVGCDGKKSVVRSKCSNVSYTGSPYCDTFLMGDFKDNTHFGKKAAIFLSDTGLVECFPLPGGMRRWVCSTDNYVKQPSVQMVSDLVQERTHYDITQQENTMISSFGVQGYVVNQFYDHEHCRFVLAGDSAHICSPLGGQGMNLGWLDAWELATTFHTILTEKTTCVRTVIQQYNKKQMERAQAVVHRAEMNMMLGRKPKYLFLRNAFVRLCLIPFTPLQYTIASFFTMRWLGFLKVRSKVFA